jgi:hypothetical protein
MAGDIKKLVWADLATAPSASGIYAWYCRPQITDFDLNTTIKEIEAASSHDRGAAERVARSMLDDRVFKPFREEPYRAAIEGPLKASYSGSLEHEFDVSSGLISRVVDEPERLRVIREVLEQSAPMFASPLYIGMSINLRDRLATHKRLIERYRQARLKEVPELRNSDAGFAWQVAKREISPDRLFVFTCEIGDGDPSSATDIENILNRLYYPILGRN